MVVRKLLPKSKNFSNAVINRLLKTINTTTPENFIGKVSEVLKDVQIERNNEKNRTIDKIIALVKKKAKTIKTDSGKRRSAGLDAAGQSYFAQVKAVLEAVKKQDFVKLQELQDTLDPQVMSDIATKIEEGKKLTTKEQVLVDRQLALDTFANVMTMELEEVQDLL